MSTAELLSIVTEQEPTGGTCSFGQKGGKPGKTDSQPCHLCHKPALYRAGNRGYCKAHKQEAIERQRKVYPIVNDPMPDPRR